jgi:hypothetical protein
MNPASYVEAARPGVLRWLEAVRWPDEGWGRWKYNAHMVRPYGLIPSAQAIQLLDMLGALADVPEQQRHQAIMFLQSTQDPHDGYFKDPLVGERERVPNAVHSWEDIWGQMGAAATALEVLAARARYPQPKASFADLRRVDLREWLLSLNWANPWHVGERFQRAIAAYVRTLDASPDSARDPVLADLFHVYEHEIHDPATGMPLGKGCNDPSVAMAGSFKVIGGYLQAQRPYPHAERAVDFTLDLQHADGEFGFRNNMCINWDAVWVLRELDKQLGGGYRRADIRRAGNRLAEHLLGRYRQDDGGFAFCGDHCWEVHHSIVVSPPLPEGDMIGTIMSLRSLSYADEWNHAA